MLNEAVWREDGIGLTSLGREASVRESATKRDFVTFVNLLESQTLVNTYFSNPSCKTTHSIRNLRRKLERNGPSTGPLDKRPICTLLINDPNSHSLLLLLKRNLSMNGTHDLGPIRPKLPRVEPLARLLVLLAPAAERDDRLVLAFESLEESVRLGVGKSQDRVGHGGVVWGGEGSIRRASWGGLVTRRWVLRGMSPSLIA